MEDQQPTDTGTLQTRVAALEAELAACRHELDALRTNASIAETLLANIPPIIERFDRQLRHVYISPAFERLTGRAPEADLGKTSRELGAPEDMAAAIETALRSVFATGRPVEIEFDYAPINQASRCYRGHFVPEFGSDGTVQTVLAIEHDITEHKRSYEQIATLTQYHQAIIDNAEVYISAMDTQRNVLIWNAAAERITGYSRAEVLGNNRIYDWLYPDPAVHQAVLDTVAELLDERQSGEVAFLRRMRTRGGDLRTLSFHSRRLHDASGRAIGYVNVGVDISDHLEALEALEDERNLLRTLIDHLPDHVFLKDAAGRYVVCNLAFARLQGFDTPQDMVGLTTFDTDPPELAQRYHADDMQVMQTGRLWIDHEEPVVDADGATRWFSTTKVPRRDAAGNVVGLIGVSHDITGRKQAEQALRESEARFRYLTDNMEDAVWMRTRGESPEQPFPLVYANPAYERIFGIRLEDGYRSDSAWSGLIDPADREPVVGALQAFLDGQIPAYNVEYRITRPDGARRWIWARALPIRDEHGALQRVIGITQDITARKTAAEELTGERNLLRTLIDALPDAIYLKDASGRFVICNTANARLQGFQAPDDLVGKSGFDVDPPELAERYAAADRQVMESGVPIVDIEEPIADATGALRWFSTTKVPRRDAAGNIVGIIGVSHDITGRREAVEQREDRLRFEELLAAISAGFVDVAGEQFDMRLRQGLQRLGNYLGVDRASLLEVVPDQSLSLVTSWAAPGFEPLPPQTALAQFPRAVQAMRRGETVRLSSLDDVPADWPVDRQALAEAGVHAVLAIPLRAGDTLMGILACACLRRSCEWPEELVQRVHLVGQVFAGALAHARADRALHLSEERHRRFFENAVLGMFRHTTEGRPIHVNAAYARMFGFESPQQALATIRSAGTDLFADPSQHPPIVEHLLTRDDVLATEVLYRRRDGSLFTAVLHAWSVRDETGQVQYFEGYLEDITERKASEDALRRSEQRFRTMADFTYDWEHWIAPDGSIVYMSPSCQRITGYRREEFIADPDLLNQIVHPDDRPAYTDHVRTIEGGQQVHRLEMRVITRSGDERWIGHVCQPVYGEDGSWLGWRTSNRDITDRKQAEADQARLQAQLLQAQKMEAIGRLTAGIAHDFNNLLTVINGFAELLKMHLPPEADAGGYADKIITAGQRAASLVSKLMAFGRKQMLQPRVVDLNEIVAGMGALLHRLIGEDITLQVQLADDLWPVKVDPTQIEQVIVNLAVNARDAMPTGGRLTITSVNATLTGERVIGLDTRPAGDYVHLEVSDSGSGMSEEVKAHLFEPFYTTKPLGQGTGLGLATVYGIVRQSGGYVEVTSEEGQGTRFDIYLPRAEETVTAAPGLGTGPLSPAGAETVLVVEDDAGVRRLAAHVLRDRGYQVLEAADAATALRLAGEFEGTIHLLLSDVVMPGASGKDLAVQLSALRPGLRVVLMSGYSGDMIADRGSLPPGIEFVQKPISAGELARTVRQVLDRE